MSTGESQRTRLLTVMAQDPSVARKAGVLTTRLRVPAEQLLPGPWGHRVHVVDYDATADRLHLPRTGDLERDPYANVDDVARLTGDPRFHQQNVYAIVMATLGRFEHALGRRVGWGFRSHQLKIAPHAFADANAFYSQSDQGLLFGYFPSQDGRKTVFTCLSHDVVAHEATHALVDGLRPRYREPSSVDQEAFHEGFSDIVALLSVFAQKEIVEHLLDLSTPAGGGLVRRESIAIDALRKNGFLRLAEEMGTEMEVIRGGALRQSATIEPEDVDLASDEFMEPHRRGEVLVAAMINAFLEVWVKRLESLGEVRKGYLDRSRVAEDGAAAADRLLTAAIRALDYSPTVDLQFGDYLSALLTADREIHPDDELVAYRAVIRKVFARYKIKPSAQPGGDEVGTWPRAPSDLKYELSHFESLQRDPEEMFRFVWQNKDGLWPPSSLAGRGVDVHGYMSVNSVRPVLRIDEDGFALKETVAEYSQIIDLRVDELRRFGLHAPEGVELDAATPVQLRGGGVLILDEYGRLKFHVRTDVLGERQQRRLDHLAQRGALGMTRERMRRFGSLHRARALGVEPSLTEVW